jgi:hypothetical protein
MNVMKRFNVGCVLLSLPLKDGTEHSDEVIDIVLNILVKVAINLFGRNIPKEEHEKYKKVMRVVDGYNKLLFLLQSYKNIHHLEQIAIILGRFYQYLHIPDENLQIIKILKEELTHPLTPSNTTHILNIISALISISIGDDGNRESLIDSGVLPLLFPLILRGESDIWKDSILLLSYICYVTSIEKKNLVIKSGAFIILHQKFIEISPPPPAVLLRDNYFSLSWICAAIYKLVTNNSDGVDVLLFSPLIPCLLQTLESATSIAVTSSSTEDIVNIQKWICVCFIQCTRFSYEQSVSITKHGVINSLLKLWEKHVSETKLNGKKMNGDVIENISKVLFNVTLNGSNKTISKERNSFREYFDEIDGLKRMLEIFKYLVTQKNETIQEKRIVNRLSQSICRLLKSEKPPSLYEHVLIWVNDLKSSPQPVSGYNFPDAARNVWGEMIDADECLKNYQK